MYNICLVTFYFLQIINDCFDPAPSLLSFKLLLQICECRDIQHDDKQFNDTLRNNTQNNDNWHLDTLNNNTEHSITQGILKGEVSLNH